ncbi:MAG: DUF3368 domain-containing protein [Firmicutes bacterium]|nr:DUF3368 domain-containing protein [Bacillota bacterium]
MIALASIDKINLLKELYGEIHIPKAVQDEIIVKTGSKAQIAVDNFQDWIIVSSIKNIETKRFFKIQLHDGEVEVMILGKELKADTLIIDDSLARKYAKYLGFKITGTLGVILNSKEQGIIKYVKPLIDGLVDNGIYIEDSLYQSILRIAGE